MSETQTSMKVYELAKELGMDSFGLLDMLKQIDIEVKSHMSSLAADQATAVREHVSQKSRSSKKATKKKTTRKKTAKTTTATATKKAASKKVIKRRPAKPEETEGMTAPKVVTTTETTLSLKELIAAPNTPAEEPTAATTTPATSAAEKEAPQSASQEAIEAEKIAWATKERQESIAPETAFKKIDKKKEEKPGESKKENKLVDEMLDHTFMSRKLKIVKDAPVAEPEDKKRKTRRKDQGGDNLRTPGGPSPDEIMSQQNKAAGRGSREMFKPVTSVLSRNDDQKRGRGAGSRAGTTQPTAENVRATDFRKREIIFQPKRKKLPPGKMLQKTTITTPSAQKRKIKVTGNISVAELAQRMGEKPKTLMRKFLDVGEEITNVHQELDVDTASLLATEFTYEIENVSFDESRYLGPGENMDADQKVRPPIVAIMGHVDHGKTTLLDTIRSASVVKGEAGGITQHIGAYSVQVKSNKEKHDITFLDTPGHEAFQTMRQRGANATDIVVLVVAADDGIMPQTKEAIRHAQNAEVPIIVAANKMDTPEANIDRLKQSLSEHNILVEDWGGEVPMVPVSALKNDGIKDLLEAISLQAEMLELKGNPKRNANGIVLESRIQKGHGIVTDVVVQNGTLRSGDYIVCGAAYGRVRAMMSDQGKVIKSVAPGFPVEFTGLNDVPSAGELFNAVETEAIAKEIVGHRKEVAEAELKTATEKKPKTLEELFAAQEEAEGKKLLNIMLKADVFGSLEAIEHSIAELPNDKVTVKIIHKAVGQIIENDVLMAATSGARVFGFNVQPDGKARQIAKRDDVLIESHSIIYELLDQIKSSMEDLLDPTRVETQIGTADVKQPFNVSKVGRIAGSSVADGKVIRHSWAKIIRGKDTVCEGEISSLKRFKDDVKETTKGQECGIGVDGYSDIEPGDIIQIFRIDFQKARL